MCSLSKFNIGVTAFWKNRNKSGTYDAWCDGAMVWCNGAMVRCDGTVRWCDGTVRWCDGTLRWCDGTVRWYGAMVRWYGAMVRCDGAMVRCDGVMVWYDGAMVRYDGMRLFAMVRNCMHHEVEVVWWCGCTGRWRLSCFAIVYWWTMGCYTGVAPW